MLKACLNGGVTRAQRAAVPITPAELAADAVRCAAAGAGAVHVHPRDRTGVESLAAHDIGAAVEAIRTAATGLPIGVSTGAWIAPDPTARIRAIQAWTVLPDFASVNVHEEGAVEVGQALHRLGVGVEAGVWTVDAMAAYARWSVPCVRVLVECMAADEARALADAAAMLALVPRGSPPVLLHAEGPAAWSVLRDAIRRGLDSRVGLEDVRNFPDGQPAPDNVSLVVTARGVGAH
ncbi:MAG TPA: 3-keto-5-aminohexanoate cleavage protein [Micromonosporaceae bacterium]|nr:3-keto-5-aminohexanoate cleavage protein [Micromonosporaceae bacterium]